MRAIFSLIDRNRDGEIGRRDIWRLFKAVAKSMDLTLKKGWYDEIKAGVKEVDADGNRRISVAEIMNWVSKHGHKYHGITDLVRHLAGED